MNLRHVALVGTVALSSIVQAEEAKDLLKEAEQAYVKADYQRAAELAQKGSESNPNRAWRILGASHCALKDKAKAQESLSKIDKAGQQYVRYVCQRHKISLD